ncbi:hypothetical protein DV38_13360 [Leptospira interrogans]|nr:hypothetical protein DV38_13360 [Leptospira interrogans]
MGTHTFRKFYSHLAYVKMSLNFDDGRKTVTLYKIGWTMILLVFIVVPTIFKFQLVNPRSVRVPTD